MAFSLPCGSKHSHKKNYLQGLPVKDPFFYISELCTYSGCKKLVTDQRDELATLWPV